MKHKLFLGMILGLTLLSACSEKDYTLHFKEEMVLDYKGKENTISLIESIGDTKITKKHIKNNSIELDNFIVLCESVDTSKMGNYEVTYKTNASENRLFTKKVIVKDISPPKIKFKKKTIELSIEEYKTYNFAEQISITDNYEEEPKVEILVDDVVEAGKSYKIVVKAEDKFGNKAKDSFTLKIKPQEKPKGESKPITNEKPQYTPPNNTQSKPPTTNSSNIENNIPSTPPANKPKPANRDFLFADGYTMENVTSVCQQALFSSGASGSCIPLTDENGIYIGMRLQFY